MQEIISEQIALLSRLTTDLHEFFDLLISTITLPKYNILYPNILTPNQLQEELSKIQLKSDQQFPIPIDISNIHYYFKIIE